MAINLVEEMGSNFSFFNRMKLEEGEGIDASCYVLSAQF